MEQLYPESKWQRETPSAVGFDTDLLERAREWMNRVDPPGGYRALVVRRGRIVAEWMHGIEPDAHMRIYSAGKSVYSNILGIAIAEGKIPNADARVVDYYPAMMEVPDGRGPKPGRYAMEKDRGITFRQLISNTSGYMKPGETPGDVFHYQTFGMNILSHALASLYGHYDPEHPDQHEGIGATIREKIAEPIGASFTYSFRNFEHAPDALIGVFGNYTEVQTDPYDAARLGLLWLSGGSWAGRQIVPGEWFAESTRVNADLKKSGHEDTWRYGYGIWTNEYGKLFDSFDGLPKSAFSACGAHGHFITVFPEQDLVVVQNPGPYRIAGRANPEFLRLIVESIVD